MFAFDGITVGSEHFSHETREIGSICLPSDQRIAKRNSFPGENARERVPEAIVHLERGSDLTSSDADVASRNVSLSADVRLRSIMSDW
jgi:hypothetical protein